MAVFSTLTELVNCNDPESNALHTQHSNATYSRLCCFYQNRGSFISLLSLIKYVWYKVCYRPGIRTPDGYKENDFGGPILPYKDPDPVMAIPLPPFIVFYTDT